jgi:cupin superfamily acireductone dioxygenase involved in methionine salvage
VEPGYVDDEERLYSDVVQNLRWACHAENQDEADIDACVIDDEGGEDEDLPPVRWDPENPQMEEGSIFASMNECRNALVTYVTYRIKAECTFKVDKSNTVRYRVHCPTDDLMIVYGGCTHLKCEIARIFKSK